MILLISRVMRLDNNLCNTPTHISKVMYRYEVVQIAKDINAKVRFLLYNGRLWLIPHVK